MTPKFYVCKINKVFHKYKVAELMTYINNIIDDKVAMNQTVRM